MISQLQPASISLCLKIEKKLKSDFNHIKNKIFLISLSGGADSTALLAIFNLLSKRLNFFISALHINHGLRENAELDASFSQNLCQEADIPFHLVNFDVARLARKNKIGVEEAGHWARISILKKIAAQIGAVKAVLAHHAKDQAEEIIMRLIRGAGWPALGGMLTLNTIFYRPFLNIPAEELRNFLIREQISWREDETNASLDYKRNRIRHLLLPLLEYENPNIYQSINRLNRLAQVDRDYWQQEIERFFFKTSRENSDTFFMSRSSLSNIHMALRLRIYIHVLENMYGMSDTEGQPNSDVLFKLDHAFQEGKLNKCFQFAGGIYAYLKKEGIIFSRNL